jgi:hypothetical protein
LRPTFPLLLVSSFCGFYFVWGSKRRKCLHKWSQVGLCLQDGLLCRPGNRICVYVICVSAFWSHTPLSPTRLFTKREPGLKLPMTACGNRSMQESEESEYIGDLLSWSILTTFLSALNIKLMKNILCFFPHQISFSSPIFPNHHKL